MFHKDNCSVIAIQDATEDSVTGPDLVANLNRLRLFSRFQLDRETNEYARLITTDCWARLIISEHGSNVDTHRLIPPLILC